MRDGFIKIAAATPDLHVADCAYNTSEIVKLAKEAAAKGAKLITFPELCLTGYTCGDLFLQETLLEGAMQALGTVCRETAELQAVIVVGLPMRYNGKLYNIAAPIVHGRVLAFVPKTHIPNYSEFYEQRHFYSGKTLDDEGIEAKNIGVKTLNEEYNYIHIGNDFIFRCEEQPLFTFGVEICEDLWVPNPPSTTLAQMGAHIIVNLSASDEIIGKAGYRRDLVRQQSGRLLCAYLYADAGFGESTQDLVFAGHDLIAENGALLIDRRLDVHGLECNAVGFRQLFGVALGTGGCAEARHGDSQNALAVKLQHIECVYEHDKRERGIQSAGQTNNRRFRVRMAQTGGKAGRLQRQNLLAALIAEFLVRRNERRARERAVGKVVFHRRKRERLHMAIRRLEGVHALALMCKALEVDIRVNDALREHLALGQSKDDLSVTFENGQARMRTLVLMNLANKNGGMVVGTGDLSELALGWATYNGDHMSMYGVNGSIPKTLVRYLVAYEADRTLGELSDVLQDVLDTPVSPELLPPKDGDSGC